MKNQNINDDRRKVKERREFDRRIEDREKKVELKLEKIFDDQVEGRNAVLELLESRQRY